MKRFMIAVLLLVITLPAHANPVSDIFCLAEGIFIEARGLPQIEKIYVGNVINNRKNGKNWPDSYCGVLNQKGQFPWTTKMSMNERIAIQRRNPKEYRQAVALAWKIMTGAIPDKTGGALYFHNHTDGHAWAAGLDKLFVSRYHVFYGQ